MKLNTEVLSGLKAKDLPSSILTKKISNDFELIELIYQIEIHLLSNQIKELKKLIDNQNYGF